MSFELTNYYDDVWLMMRTQENPVSITTGTIQQVGDDLFLIHAEEAIFTIVFEE